MRIFFSILSVAYIAGIFFFADSSVDSTLASFNPYSLLHIPLYGILTVLLIFSFLPLRSKSNVLNEPNDPNVQHIHALTHPRIYASTHLRLLTVGFIALIVAIADEIHQAYVPGRDASITDVLLDMVGIILVLFFFFRVLKTKTSFMR
jgi:VanZ family protein